MITDTRSSIYTELDCLLDTRLSVFRQAGVTGEELFGNKEGWYWSRLDNDPSGITNGRVTQADINALWSNRDMAVLEDTMPTLFCREIGELIRELSMTTQRFTNGSKIHLTVNVYPYKLTNAEMRELEMHLPMYTGFDVKLSVEYIPFEQLSLNNCRHRYSYMIVYNFEEWMTHHVDQLGVHPNDDFMVLAPQIAYNKTYTTVEYQGEQVNPFASLGLMFSGSFTLEFLDITYYSVPLPSELDRGLKSSGFKVSTPIRS